MPDAPDPLGKRALFWAPAERHEQGPRTPTTRSRSRQARPFLGRRIGDRRLRADGLGSDRRMPERRAGRITSPSRRRARGRRGPAGPCARSADLDHLERPSGSGMFGSLTLQCSSCRVRSQVDLVEFVVLHLPLWLWRPGRGYTRFMTCPACRRRTWISASWRR